MTRYYDKHGTEIFKGDKFERACAPGRPLTQDGGWLPEAFEDATVLSRADGTPVYRYEDGKDIRIGDVLNFFGGDYYVRGFSSEHGDTTVRVSDGEYLNPASCTLIRRADESEKRTPDLAAIAGATFCKKHQSYFITRCGLCERDEVSPVLGHDRNGREVRAGVVLRDIVQGWRGTVQSEKAGGFYCDRDERGGRDHPDKFWTPQSQAELVDEQAGQYRGPSSHHCGTCNRRVAGDVCEDCVERGAIAGEIQSLCRAIAQPTMGERLAALKANVANATQSWKRVEAVFDIDEYGPWVLLRLVQPPFEPFEKRFDESLNCADGFPMFDHVERWATIIGEHVVCGLSDLVPAGRAILRGGK